MRVSPSLPKQTRYPGANSVNLFLREPLDIGQIALLHAHQGSYDQQPAHSSD